MIQQIANINTIYNYCVNIEKSYIQWLKTRLKTMTQTADALAAQTALLNQFSVIIKGLIQQVSTLQADKDAALAQVASLLGLDQASATAILANNPIIQQLIDEASAATPAASSTTAPAAGSSATPATDSSATSATDSSATPAAGSSATSATDSSATPATDSSATPATPATAS